MDSRTLTVFVALFLLIPPSAVRSDDSTAQFGVTAIKLKSSAPDHQRTRIIHNPDTLLTVDVEENTELHFSYALHPDTWKKQTGPARFEVVAQTHDGQHSLHKAELNPRKSIRDRGWQSRTISLSRFSGQKIKILFAATGPAGGPIWGGVRVGNFQRKDQQLNVILVSLDTLRPDHLGVGGYKVRKTSPHIDALAAGGVYFSQAVAPSPWTKPSHMTALTGLYPSHHGMVLPHFKDKKTAELSTKIPTLTEVLANQGYLTQAFTGSAHLAAEYGYYHGFDGYDETQTPYQSDAGFVFGEGFKWLEKNAQNRFFLFLHTYEIHSPYKYDRFVTPKMKKMETLHARYDSGIYAADEWIGKLQSALDRLKLTDHTVLILFSDHGEELLQRGYRVEHSHTLYDEMMRVPFLVRAPEITPRPLAYQAELTDIMPTVLSLLKIKTTGLNVQGRDLSSMLFGGPPPEESFAIGEAVYFGPEMKAIRYWSKNARHKLIALPSAAPFTADLALHRSAFNPSEKYHSEWGNELRQSRGERSFDLMADPEERRPLDQAHPALDPLRDALRRYIQDIPSEDFSIPAKGWTQKNDDLLEQLKSLGY